ncbi:MAG: alpha/beta hydrolase [Saprospiraceae bacterium]|nr:alpha/beta hydrolase [Lewinella sp.]
MERYIQVNTTKIWTTASGKGTPLLLCNGGPGCDDYLQPVSALLEDICQVIRFEPRGCGRSDYDEQYHLDQTIEDIEAIRQAYGIDRWIVSGHSAGPDVALAYTIRYPDRVMGLIGIAGGRIVNDREWSAVYKKNLAEQGEDYGGKIFQADPAVNKLGVQSWRAYIKRPELLHDIANIQVPAIFINAGNDIRPNWPTQQLAALIPKGHYFEIPNAAHCIWLTHAEELEVLLKKAIQIINQH